MHSPPVRNISLQLTGARRGGLLEAVVDHPIDGGASEAWAIRVRGHFLGPDGPPRSVEAVAPGRLLATAPVSLPTPDVAARRPGIPGAETCGFTLLVDTLALPRHFEFRLRATMASRRINRVVPMRPSEVTSSGCRRGG